MSHAVAVLLLLAVAVEVVLLAMLAARSASRDLLMLSGSCTFLLIAAATLTAWRITHCKVLAPACVLDTAIGMVTAELTVEKAALEVANEELKRLSEAKSDFVAAVSHELRTPLTAITEGIGLIADGSLGPTNENQASLLGLAHRNCVRLGGLIDELIDLSRIESGRMDMRLERVDIARAASDAADASRRSAEQRGLKLEVSAPAVPVFVRADARMVRSILSNLAGNALKFTDQGSISVRVAANAGFAQVDFNDTGVGIPHSEQPGVFEKFHQVVSPNRGRPAGVGLGLALTKCMVEMSGGRIWFESQERVGSTFHFTLPLDGTDGRSGDAP